MPTTAFPTLQHGNKLHFDRQPDADLWILQRLEELYAAAKLTKVSDDLGNTDGST